MKIIIFYKLVYLKNIILLFVLTKKLILSQNLKYYSQLDGIRCFAIISVLIGHWIAWETDNVFVRNAPWGLGVILFFVLSGYLIGNILFETRENIENNKTSFLKSIRIFYIRRVLRIFPIYYILIFFLYYIDYLNTREIFPWLSSFTTNFYEIIYAKNIGDYNHFWSLAVEEQFYLFWPFLILLCPKNKIVKLLITLIIISIFSRILSVYFGGENWYIGAYFTPNFFFPLALGSLLAYIKRYKVKLFNKLNNPKLIFSSILLYGLMHYFLHYKFHLFTYSAIFDQNLFSIVCFFVIARASNNGFKNIFKFILEHDIIVFTGKISYGLYIYHLFIIGFFWNYICPTFNISITNIHVAWFCYFILVYLLAIASFYTIEKPINSLKKYFSYKSN